MDEEVAKILKAEIKMANNLTLHVGEDDTGVVPGELMNQELLELEQEHIAEEKRQGKKETMEKK